ncbi:Rne/Rng family ribonuclease [Kineosporia sp. J2-2]|uniref:Rne/Rng family ribonuclease n=1 Tax=Kineosporia corallincola TaxID=2835133 RepID=A0ABS5TRZ7_9ACTN|nr:ribonuclease E/G [Kineosporia corallincola]MBT0773560.1 Rne/Rng family ribonuclease [Kineosporia corallincola]
MASNDETPEAADREERGGEATTSPVAVPDSAARPGGDTPSSDPVPDSGARTAPLGNPEAAGRPQDRPEPAAPESPAPSRSETGSVSLASDEPIAVPDGAAGGDENTAVVPDPEAPATTTRRRSTRARTAKKAAAAEQAPTADAGEPAGDEEAPAPVKRARATRKRTTAKRAAATVEVDAVEGEASENGAARAETAAVIESIAGTESAPAAPDALFEEPAAPAKKTTRRRSTRKASAPVTRPAADTLAVPGDAPAGEPVAEPVPESVPETTPVAAVAGTPAQDALADQAPVTQTSAAQAPDVQVGQALDAGSRNTDGRAARTQAAEAPVTDADSTQPQAQTQAPAETRPSQGSRTAAVQSPVAEPFAPRTRPRTRARSAAERAAEAAAEEAARAAAQNAPGAESADTPADEAPAQASPTRPGIMPIFQAPEPVAQRPRRAASRPAGPPKHVDLAEQAEPDQTAAAPATGPAAGESEVEGVDAGQADTPDETTDLLDDETDETTDVLEETDVEDAEDAEADEDTEDADENEDGDDQEESSAPRRRRRRGGRGRRGRSRGDASDQAEPAAAAGPDGADEPEAAAEEPAADDAGDEDEGEEAAESTGSRRRRRRRRRGSGGTDGEVTVDEGTTVTTKVRESRRGSSSDDVTSVRGSTRLEAKKQRRREGREAGRRRTILTEAEFLARRESVERTMVVRERDGRTQIGVLEDGVLVEHYVARKTQTSTVGNVYLGRVQNVLPSMEAAFVDIGKGRNAVLYAGEVNWDAAGLEGQPRRIEHALKAGDAVLVQVTKDPIGHKGARLTSQISMPGRYLVYVPDGSMTGISRKLPDTERTRLKKILREVVPDNAGVIVRTAAEGASDDELERDVQRLQAQWEDISAKVSGANAPAMLYGEPDLAIKVVRDVFNEDFNKLIISGDEAWDTLRGYISHVAPDLEQRLQHWDGDGDVFAKYRIDEQIAKGLDRKVWLPSGGSLVIDRTEAMTVIDVNTGKFTGAGGNLEETVTKNNLEAAEEVVHQLRLRDIGGIIVVDFIDMVLESNRDLVLRRLLECLGRDRTRHQVAEVTSLGLVQMTRKRVGQGLLEVFSETCEHCGGRGLIMHDEPVEKKQQENNNGGGGGGRKGRNNNHH